MRVVIAPDKFAGTVTAAGAAAGIARGWQSRHSGDELLQMPMSDGGPGFLRVLAAALTSSQTREVTTTDPLGRPVSASVLLHNGTAYVESAQAVGLHLLVDAERDPERTTSAGLAALLEAAQSSGASRIVVGLGGSATNDGGRGLIETLASRGSLARLKALDLVIATDVDNPLLGPAGASAVFAAQKGADREGVARLEGRMQEWVAELDGLEAVAARPGAGAAGGLGAACFWLGGRREPGAALVSQVIGLEAAMQDARLVVTGEGAYDITSLRGKVVAAVAAAATRAALPCIVVAGQVSVGQREAAAHGVDETLALADLAGSAGAAIASPEVWLEAAGEKLAARWARS